MVQCLNDWLCWLWYYRCLRIFCKLCRKEEYSIYIYLLSYSDVSRIDFCCVWGENLFVFFFFYMESRLRTFTFTSGYASEINLCMANIKYLEFAIELAGYRSGFEPGAGNLNWIRAWILGSKEYRIMKLQICIRIWIDLLYVELTSRKKNFKPWSLFSASTNQQG